MSVFDKRGIERRFKNGHNSKNTIYHPRWKGGRIIHSKGYVMVQAKWHPRADKGGYVFEHILVMEQYLGRYLTEDEIVHHINHNKQDNRIENLLLTTKTEHRHIYHAKEVRVDMSSRVCIDCGTKTPSLNRKGRPKWYLKGGIRCHSCYLKHKSAMMRASTIV